MFSLRKTMKTLVIAGVPVTALVLGGCASDEPEIHMFDTITPRPAVDSVGDDTLFVAQMSGPGGFTFDIPRGYRYYLVDLEADRVLHSGITESSGKLEVGKDGATFDGDDIWEGDTQSAMDIGLFLAARPEQTEGLD